MTAELKAPTLHRLFQPIRLNRLELPNRVLMGSIHLNLDDCDDQYTRKAIFYAERARHGIGLMITAGCSPNQAGNTSSRGFCLDDEVLVESHRQITQAVHEAGGRIALQLLHFGREAFHGQLVSASAIRLKANLFKPRALTHDEVLQTINDYADAALRAVQAGYDAIELVFSQGFLIHQFLAPKTNRREDQWGGTLENRMRLAVEVAQRVRKAVGPHFPLLFRIPCLDLLEEGLEPRETITLIDALRPSGIDLLNVSIGWHESDVPTIAMVVPRAAFSPVAAQIKRQFPSLNVCVSNRINDPRVAERLLADGVADMVSMARPFLADPALLSKARGGHFDGINTCIACNQSCLDFVFTGRTVGCSVNPECNDKHEGRVPPLKHTRRVLVIGGGLAGMCAAVYLARRGADVTLAERDNVLGGQLRMASRIPNKQEFGETVRYFTNALHEHGVDVRLGTSIDDDFLQSNGWHHVYVATGSEALETTDVPIDSNATVLSYEQVLLHQVPVRYPVAVIGGGGVACDVAKYLAAQWHEADACSRSFLLGARRRLPGIAFGEPYEKLGEDAPANGVTPVVILQRSTRKTAHKLGRTTRWIVMNELDRLGVRVERGITVRRISAHGVEVVRGVHAQREIVTAATVIMAVGQRPRVEIAMQCKRLNLPHTCLGAMTTGGSGNASITSATTSAYHAALALE